MRPTKIGFGAIGVAFAVTALMLSSWNLVNAAPQNDPIELRNPYFDWVDVKEDGALFEWSVDVTNNTAEPVQLQVILDLLDDDDRPINRDEQNNPLNAVIVTVQPGTTMPVEQQGIIDYDRAAQVVTYRHRHRVIR